MTDIRSAVLASRDGMTSTVQAYLAEKRDPNFTDHTGIRLLHIAAQNRHVEIVRVLVVGGADVNVLNRDGQTPLFQAVTEHYCGRYPDHRTRSVEIVRLLLAARADPHLGEPPLAEAAKLGSEKAVKLLLEAGASVNHPDPRYQSTALIAAINGGQEALASMLIAVGADVNQGDQRGQTPLSRAIEGPGTVSGAAERKRICLAIAKSLIAKGADPNRATTDGRSPLMAAVNENWPEMIALLLRAGADARHQDLQGRGLARRALDGALRLNLPDDAAVDLVRTMVIAGAADKQPAADWARERGRAALADAIARL